MSVVQEIKSRIELVEIVSTYVTLEKSGNNYKANCPFHNEKTPSFFVFPETQTWRCFGGCASGGDLLSFVMNAENMDFGRALHWLADRAGIKIPSYSQMKDVEALYDANLEASDFFCKLLYSSDGSIGREYLASRGVSDETRDTFQIGVSPKGRDVLFKYLIGRGHKEEDIINAGLATIGDNGLIRDHFRHRLMFPIHTESGRIAGFGGRVFDESMPKYLNTSRTDVFDKGRLLYGMHIARASIDQNDMAVIVEGYMDVIAAHQHGFSYVVASMGTALTEQQVKVIKNRASNVALALDPDSAGREATLRSLESSWKAMRIDFVRPSGRSGVIFNQRHLGGSLTIVNLPHGRDPDLLIRDDPMEWDRLVSEAEPLLDYLLRVMPARYDLSQDDGKLQLVDALGPFIKSEANAFTRRRYLTRLAQEVVLNEAELENYIWRSDRRVATSRRASASGPDANQANPVMGDILEQYCLYLMFNYPELKDADIEISSDFFDQAENRDLFTRWTDCSTMDALMDSIPDYLSDHLREILSTDAPPFDLRERHRAFAELCSRLKERFLKLQEQSLLQQMHASDWTDGDKLQSITEKTQEINAGLRRIYSARESIIDRKG